MLGYQGMHLLLLLLLSFTTHKVNKIRSLQIGEKSDDDDDTPKNEKKSGKYWSLSLQQATIFNF